MKNLKFKYLQLLNVHNILKIRARVKVVNSTIYIRSDKILQNKFSLRECRNVLYIFLIQDQYIKLKKCKKFKVVYNYLKFFCR